MFTATALAGPAATAGPALLFWIGVFAHWVRSLLAEEGQDTTKRDVCRSHGTVERRLSPAPLQFPFPTPSTP